MVICARPVPDISQEWDEEAAKQTLKRCRDERSPIQSYLSVGCDAVVPPSRKIQFAV